MNKSESLYMLTQFSIKINTEDQLLKVYTVILPFLYSMGIDWPNREMAEDELADAWFLKINSGVISVQGFGQSTQKGIVYTPNEFVKKYMGNDFTPKNTDFDTDKTNKPTEYNKEELFPVKQKPKYKPYKVESPHKDLPNYREITTKNVRKGDTLIIHPDDRSTDFLKPSYVGMDATVLTSRRDMFNLRETMKNHNRIIMMGHGSPSGLMLSMVGGAHGVDIDEDGDLIKYSSYTLGYDFLDILKTKPIVAVWCNADKFIVPNDLHGFYTGMAISELSEANYCGVHGCNQKQLEESDDLFAEALKAAIPIRSSESVDTFKRIYDDRQNPIMIYNLSLIHI